MYHFIFETSIIQPESIERDFVRILSVADLQKMTD